MVEDNDDQKLNSLESRLKAARGPEEQEAEEPPVNPVGVAWKLGTELVVGVAVGAFLGLEVDKWLDSKPVALIILVMLGFGAGIRNVLREARKLQDGLDDE